MLTLAWCRPNGIDQYLVTPNLLHLFDFSMSMLPFAVKTDMLNAMKAADVQLKEHMEFMESLEHEHDSDQARNQLRELWATWISQHHSRDQAAASLEVPRLAFGKIPTPPASPKPGDPRQDSHSPEEDQGQDGDRSSPAGP